MKKIKWATLLILLPFVSACSTANTSFLQNFTKDNQAAGSSASSPIVKLAYSKEGFLVVGHESGSIDIWDTKKSQSKREISAHKYPANSLTFSSDGDVFFSSSYFENSTKLWNVKTGEQLFLVRHMNGPVGTTPNKQFYVIANGDHVRLFDYKQKLLLAEKYMSGGTITTIATDTSFGLIAVGTESGSIDVWKYSENKGTPILTKASSAKPYEFGDWVVGLQFSTNGTRLYSITRFGSIDEWLSGTLEKKRSLPVILKYVYSTAFLRDKGLLALAGTEEKIGTGPGSVELISLATGEFKSYRISTNTALVEFLPPISSLIAVQNKSTNIFALPKEK